MESDDLLIKYDVATKLYGYQNQGGKEIIPCRYSRAENYSEGLALVGIKKEGENSVFQQFYITVDGKVAIPYEKTNSYRELWGFVEGRARVSNEDYYYGFIDKDGNLVVSCKYWNADYYSEGLTPVTINEKSLYGFIDLDGKLVIPYKFKDAKYFSNGLAPVQSPKTDLWGYVDKSGKIAIRCIYKDAYSFDGNFALVSDGNGYGYINTSGKKILPNMYGRQAKYFEGIACSDYSVLGYWTQDYHTLVNYQKYVFDDFSIEGFVTTSHINKRFKEWLYTFCDLNGNRVEASSECDLEIKVLEMYKALIKKPQKVKKILEN